MNETQVLKRTALWVDKVVIGLNLCPFAKAVRAKGQIRYVVSQADTSEGLLEDVERELLALAAADPELVDTTILIHPRVLADFRDSNDFVHEAEARLSELELDGELQIASFHPNYCFADASADDPANCTNRSPYPMLHFLREASITRALASFPDPSSIYERNVQTLRGMDAAFVAALVGDDD